MAAKCNIVGFVLQKLDETQWGIKTCDNVDKAILEDYLTFLNCDDVPPTNCYPVDCKNDPIVFTCNVAVAKLSVTIDGDRVYFTANPLDIIGATEPIEYLWSFDTVFFDLVGPINEYQLQLQVKPGKDLESLVTKVGLTITDANGCEATKECYLTPTGMQCNVNFVPCPNPSNLQIINIFTQCSGPSGLIISKI